MLSLKTNLHFHTAEDKSDKISYTLKEGIDYAVGNGFEVLAVTCHRAYTASPEHVEYAADKGLLLIPGVELNVDEDPHAWGRHLILLNVDEKAADITTFKEVEEYKKYKPDVFVLAPHPYFYGNFSLHEYLEKYIHLVDAIEYSWFYSKRFNRNLRAEHVAKKHNLPLISTSDTHYLLRNHMNRNYAQIHAKEKTTESVFAAIRSGNFKNVTEPSNFWIDMVAIQGWYFAKNAILRKVSSLEK